VDSHEISLKKVKVHNLKNVDLTLTPNQLIVFTGVSGSGKSSLAFDTLYIEGQRRYVESLSTFARRQLGDMIKPDLEYASGISPTISIEQKTAGRNPRSTVGTITEIYDYLRVLYARIGIPHCPVSGEPVTPQSRERIIRTVQSFPEGTKAVILSPYARGKKAEFKEDFQELLRKGYMRARVDGKIITLDEEAALDGSVAHDVDVVIDRMTINQENQSRIAEAMTNALNLGDGVASVLNTENDEEQLFSIHAYSVKSGLSYSSLEPHDFSFNSPSGMCPKCHGLGISNEFDLSKIINPDASIAEDCCSVGSSYQTVRYGNIYDNLADLYGFSVHTPWKKLSEKARHIFLYGTEKKWTRMRFIHPVTGNTWTDHVQWRGVLYEAHSRFSEAKSEVYRKNMQKNMQEQVCPACKGERLKPYPAATLLNGKRIAEISSMTIGDCLTFFLEIMSVLTPQEILIANELLKEIQQRLNFLVEVGLSYLSLDRTAPTLSGGEAQRVRLASQIGSGLVGITYVLDEPSIGLHPRDNTKLVHTLKHLRDMGNTVIVVEHDEETIWEADHIVDFGPGPGSRGGRIIVDGDLKDLIKSEESLTSGYLTGRLKIAIPKKRRKARKEHLLIVGATHHNLKNISVKIPLGVFIAVTGVSGSGKSSLITDILYPALSNHLHAGEHTVGAHKEIKGIDAIDKIIAIDQTPIGRNPRSNPATYIKLFDDIRDLFTQLPESIARGYKPGRFSFNVKEGSCPQCQGMGLVKVDMDFMEDAWIDCPLCHTRRFDEETLSIYYKGKNIYDVLEMEVAEALEFFTHIPAIKHKLETLKRVGMGYIKLGQSSTTLSGGEAQRIKLAKELTRPSTGNTLYIFDEPTTGLHFHDIKHLLEVLQEFVDRGNTVLVIEHNMDVVKTADWIIDIGPDGGKGGGEIVAAGTPEKISLLETPTGKAVYDALNSDPQEKVTQALKRLNSQKSAKKATNRVQEIIVSGAEQNNLKYVSVNIPREKITICTGPSGSGKSSFAFDTVYAEGQRRYIESLSPYARQFVQQMPKPKVGHIEGLSPAIAIEQKAHAGNPRSTVGTMTETYDYLRILYARLGIAHHPETGERIQEISKDHVVNHILEFPEGEKIQVLAPIEIRKNEKFEDVISRLQKQGFLRIRLNGEFFDIDSDDFSGRFDRKRKNEIYLVIDRLKISKTQRQRLFESVDNAAKIGNGKLLIAKDNKDVPFNLAFSVESTGESFAEITPHTFAFNHAFGMCPDCQGLGYQYGANLTHHPEVMSQSATSLMRYLWNANAKSQPFSLFQAFLKVEKIDPFTPLNQLPHPQLQMLMNGSPADVWYQTSGFKFRWVGINNAFAKAGKNGLAEIKQGVLPMLDELPCLSCQGGRLNPVARHVTINDVSICDLCRLPIDKAYAFINALSLSSQEGKLLDEVKKQLLNKLSFMIEVGLHYLSLERRAPSLSGGEAQRIRLARQLGSGLTGVLYVLDEPTIGLHPRDNHKLNQALAKLKGLGNTLLMVEHDPLTLATADYIIDFGPHSGEHGGHITAQGTLEEIKNNPASLTGQYLSGKLSILIPKKRRKKGREALTITHARVNNLKDISVSIPIGLLTCLVGVSGSGKSTLLHQILLPAVEQGVLSSDSITYKGATVKGIDHIDKVLSIDQKPIGSTSRSDVGTYTDILTKMREFFAALPQAKVKGLQGKHFSYNHRSGMCTSCWGMGYRKIEMHFLPPVKVVCEECQEMRLNPVSLKITYAGKNFGECLQLTVDEARLLFQNHPRIVRSLDTLISVGLGYLKLGQEVASLSGGEAQRIKLSRELAKRSTGRTLYLLDEPTTGLHADDIKTLLGVLQKLVDKGNTMVIIEHNLDVIKCADHLIEIGPEAGEEGGYVVCTGTPEQVAKVKNSWTGSYL